MKKFFLLACIAAGSLSANAQNTQTGYFSEGYLFSHYTNPAAIYQRSYVSVPLIGNIMESQRGNVGMGDFLYFRDGKTVTFMHPSVDTDEAIKPFSNRLRMENNLRMDVVSIGIARKGHDDYITAGISIRSNVSASLPGQLFHLAKEGPNRQSYDFSSLHVNSDAFVEVSGGYSRKINNEITVGGKAKLLFGLEHIDATADGTRLTLNNDRWEAAMNAEVNACAKGLSLVSKTEMRGPEGHEVPHTFVNDVEYDTPGLNGFGLAFDMGATYRLADMTTFGLSIVDLGFIHWFDRVLASTDGLHNVSTDQYTFSADKNAPNSFKEEWERLGDAVADIYELKDMGPQSGCSRYLGATLNVSAEVEMPFYKPLKIGLLNTTRMMSNHAWNETRLSVNVAPVSWFAASLSGAAGSFGPTFGCMLNFHPKGFCFYTGFDCLPSSFSHEGVPLNRNVQLNLGMAIPF